MCEVTNKLDSSSIGKQRTLSAARETVVTISYMRGWLLAASKSTVWDQNLNNTRGPMMKYVKPEALPAAKLPPSAFTSMARFLIGVTPMLPDPP